MPPIDALVRICIPVFNDWEAVSLLLARLDDIASRWPTPLAVLLVDDGSSAPLPEALSGHPRALRSVDVVADGRLAVVKRLLSATNDHEIEAAWNEVMGLGRPVAVLASTPQNDVLLA